MLTPEGLALIAGAALSLAFEYIPGLHPWFDALDDTKKRLLMLGVLAVTTAGIFGLGCAGQLPLDFGSLTCDTAGVWQLVWLLVLAIAGNQSVHLVTKRE